jgi:hypothetical protein
MMGLKFDRPIQILTDRVKLRSEDELPAVKTAEKCLSTLCKEYAVYNTTVKRELKLIAKVKKEKLKRKNKKTSNKATL